MNQNNLSRLSLQSHVPTSFFLILLSKGVPKRGLKLIGICSFLLLSATVAI